MRKYFLFRTVAKTIFNVLKRNTLHFFGYLCGAGSFIVAKEPQFKRSLSPQCFQAQSFDISIRSIVLCRIKWFLPSDLINRYCSRLPSGSLTTFGVVCLTYSPFASN